VASLYGSGRESVLNRFKMPQEYLRLSQVWLSFFEWHKSLSGYCMAGYECLQVGFSVLPQDMSQQDSKMAQDSVYF
jgi:hypothetical protein